jgi:hypothetical protein
MGLAAVLSNAGFLRVAVVSPIFPGSLGDGTGAWLTGMQRPIYPLLFPVLLRTYGDSLDFLFSYWVPVSTHRISEQN